MNGRLSRIDVNPVTMAGLEVTRGAPFVKGSFQGLADVSGIIGLAGEAKGAVVLSFPFGLARRIYGAMTGETVKEGDPAIADVVGEIANMVAYLASPLASATTGAAVRVDGGHVDSIVP